MMMLDIIANNNWERPIYFTGGSYADSEYIWMKDYLQLEGLVYKLVPIKTDRNKNNPYIMGRIDSDLMYDIVKKWEWGNSESGSIYHDPETRKNSISYRSNLARLAEKLIDENKLEKASEIIDLAFEKMPIDYFGFYSLIPPFIEGYYRLNNIEKSREIFNKISLKYQDKLNYFYSLSPSFQFPIAEEILTEIERYRALVEIILDNRDYDFLEGKIDDFIQITEKFIYLYGEYEYYKLLDEFVEGYYLSGSNNKARNLCMKILNQCKERFDLYNSLSDENQKILTDRISEEVNSYRKLVLYSSIYDDSSFTDTIEKELFNSIKNLSEFKKIISDIDN